MSTITDKLSVVSSDVLAKSEEFAQRMRILMPSILVDVGHYSNDAFLLRSFVSLRSDNQGDELAMTVDITAPSTRDSVSIASDLCLDDGTIVATGPIKTVSPSSASFEREISEWIEQFHAFLNTCEAEALVVLTEIVTKKSEVKYIPNKF